MPDCFDSRFGLSDSVRRTMLWVASFAPPIAIANVILLGASHGRP